MNVFQYFSTSVVRNGAQFGFAFEHELDLNQLVELIAQNGIIAVDRLRTAEDGNGGRLITGRERVAIGHAGIATIQIASTPHWDAPVRKTAIAA